MMSEDAEWEEAEITEEEEPDDNYVDVEGLLARKEPSERAVKAVRRLASFYASQAQISNKGKLLGHYRSAVNLRTYIDVYERAVAGRVESCISEGAEKLCWGYTYLADVLTENGVLYLVGKDDRVYKIRGLRKAEIIAYKINSQRIKIMNEEAG